MMSTSIVFGSSATARLSPCYARPMPTNPALIAIILDALRIARDEGLDDTGQTEVAVRALMAGRPALTVSEAMTLVQMHRRAKPN